MRIRAAVASDTGTVRSINQDNYYFLGKINKTSASCIRSYNLVPKRKSVFAVFDGMGGGQKGEFASLVAAQTLRELCVKLTDGFGKFAEDYFKIANKKLCDYMTEHPDIEMGTTAALIYIDAVRGIAQATNIGDSKVFHISKNKMRRISCDHNVAAEMARAGLITEADAYRHKDKNKLTQYLGIYDDELVIEPFISETIEINKGDCFVLCSDGLTDGVEEQELTSVLCENYSVRDKANQLVELAKKNGSRDNITVIVVFIV